MKRRKSEGRCGYRRPPFWTATGSIQELEFSRNRPPAKRIASGGAAMPAEEYLCPFEGVLRFRGANGRCLRPEGAPQVPPSRRGVLSGARLGWIRKAGLKRATPEGLTAEEALDSS